MSAPRPLSEEERAEVERRIGWGPIRSWAYREVWDIVADLVRRCGDAEASNEWYRRSTHAGLVAMAENLPRWIRQEISHRKLCELAGLPPEALREAERAMTEMEDAHRDLEAAEEEQPEGPTAADWREARGDLQCHEDREASAHTTRED